MTAQGLLQVALYVVVLVALAKPLGAYMADVYEGERTFLSPVLRPARAAHLSRRRRRRAERGHGLEALRARRCCCSTSSASLVVYALQRLQGVLPLNPQDFGAVSAGLVVQHGGQLRHQHELAGLRRRVDDELPDADARRSACRTSSRPRPGMAVLVALIRGFARRQASDDRQLLGRPHALARSTSCCRCRCCSRCVLVSQGVVQTFAPYKT